MSIKITTNLARIGKGQALFGFFKVGFARRQKPNVLDRALAFSHLSTTVSCMSSSGFESTNLSV